MIELGFLLKNDNVLELQNAIHNHKSDFYFNTDCPGYVVVDVLNTYIPLENTVPIEEIEKVLNNNIEFTKSKNNYDSITNATRVFYELKIGKKYGFKYFLNTIIDGSFTNSNLSLVKNVLKDNRKRLYIHSNDFIVFPVVYS